MTVHRAAQAFDRAAGVYDRVRPDYPDEAVDWLVDALRLRDGGTVVDLAAGTGKLTTALLARARARVVAVEPAPAMLARLREVAPGAEALEGTAEAIPLPNACAHAVTVAQAFHWFSNERAIAEIHRVLRPGGRLGLVWNRRWLSAPAQAALDELLEPWKPDDVPRHKTDDWRVAIDATELFEPVDSYELRWTQEVDRAGFVGRFASTSFIAALEPAEHERALAEAERVASRLEEPIELPYLAELFVYARV
jgi:ubiquinone/menaquinone biosynthesis C-methylase UbiE